MVGGELTAFTPHRTTVFPECTRAEPSAVDMEPGGETAHILFPSRLSGLLPVLMVVCVSGLLPVLMVVCVSGLLPVLMVVCLAVCTPLPSVRTSCPCTEQAHSSRSPRHLLNSETER